MDIKSFWSLHGSLSRQRAIKRIHDVFDIRAAMNATGDELREHLAPYYDTLMVDEQDIPEQPNDEARFLADFGNGI